MKYLAHSTHIGNDYGGDGSNRTDSIRQKNDSQDTISTLKVILDGNSSSPSRSYFTPFACARDNRKQIIDPSFTESTLQSASSHTIFAHLSDQESRST